jgi:hypothetical protein
MVRLLSNPRLCCGTDVLISERKLSTHIEHSVKHKDPNIQKLAKQYNKLCDDMANLITEHRAPNNAVAPLPIPVDRLWSLDVDDMIWQDVGLDDTPDSGAPPLWLCDDKVRKGIVAVLVLDRCDEEVRRLSHERCVLREWMKEEWQVVQEATQAVQDTGE